MSDQLIYVSMDIQGKTYFVGRLWAHTLKGRESATFKYDERWLKNSRSFSLEPQMLLGEGAFHTSQGKALFGAIGDSAPDRWGRVLMRRAHLQQAKEAETSPRTLNEIDYLLGVNDESRIGALRFSYEKEGPYLDTTHSKSIPPLLDLPRLLAASDHFTKHEESEEDIKILLAPGTSLGGARPKASIRDKDQGLSIAKFPRHDDEYSVVLWEFIALQLANFAGINVSNSRIETVDEQSVIIIKRFDRIQGQRIPFSSAMSMLGANDNEQHSYLEIVDFIRQYGESPKEDLEELWKRVVFNILISNTDDHLRNHGFLLSGSAGWRLSPLYDVNPTPTSIKPRILTTMIDLYDATASLDLAFSVTDEFGLSLKEAKKIAKQIADATSQWKRSARKLSLSSSEIELMESAFMHDDFKQANSLAC